MASNRQSRPGAVRGRLGEEQQSKQEGEEVGAGCWGEETVQQDMAHTQGPADTRTSPDRRREEPWALGAWEGHVAGTQVVESPVPAFCPQTRDRASYLRSHMHRDTDT